MSLHRDDDRNSGRTKSLTNRFSSPTLHRPFQNHVHPNPPPSRPDLAYRPIHLIVDLELDRRYFLSKKPLPLHPRRYGRIGDVWVLERRQRAKPRQERRDGVGQL